MSLSQEAREQFASVMQSTDPSRSDPLADGALVEYAAWALANEPTALDERFAFDRMMATRGLTDDKRRYGLTVLRTTSPLVGAYRRQRRAWVPPGRSARRRREPDALHAGRRELDGRDDRAEQLARVPFPPGRARPDDHPPASRFAPTPSFHRGAASAIPVRSPRRRPTPAP